MAPGKLRCVACGEWSGVGFGVSPDSGDLKPLSELGAAKHKRIATGPWDVCFGPDVPPFGLVTTGVTLLGGARGAGKSTFALQWTAGVIAATGGWVAYLGNEEHASEVGARAARLSLEHVTPRIHVIESLDLSLHFGVIDRLARTTRGADDARALPSGVLLDSISGLVGNNREAFLEVSRLLKVIAKVSCRCPVMVIDHITKSEQFHGPEALQHDVDTIVGLELSETTGLRYLHTSKNRYGPANLEICLQMTTGGLIPFTGGEYKDGFKVPTPKRGKRSEARS